MKQPPKKLSHLTVARKTIVTINKKLNVNKLSSVTVSVTTTVTKKMSSVLLSRPRTNKQKTAEVFPRRRCSAYWELWLDVLTLRPVEVSKKKGKGSSRHSNHPPSKSTSNLSHYHKILVDFKIMVSRTGCFDMLCIFFVWFCYFSVKDSTVKDFFWTRKFDL